LAHVAGCYADPTGKAFLTKADHIVKCQELCDIDSPQTTLTFQSNFLLDPDFFLFYNLPIKNKSLSNRAS
jgi:hypothetical protein